MAPPEVAASTFTSPCGPAQALCIAAAMRSPKPLQVSGNGPCSLSSDQAASAALMVR
jgi:hypothetical protein